MTLARPENLRVDLPLSTIAALCQRYGVQDLSIFGSALRDDHLLLDMLIHARRARDYTAGVTWE